MSIIKIFGKTLYLDNGRSEIRRTGHTTREIDELIQYFFNTGHVCFYNNKEGEHGARIFHDRLQREHGGFILNCKRIGALKKFTKLEIEIDTDIYIHNLIKEENYKLLNDERTNKRIKS